FTARLAPVRPLRPFRAGDPRREPRRERAPSAGTTLPGGGSLAQDEGGRTRGIPSPGVGYVGEETARGRAGCSCAAPVGRGVADMEQYVRCPKSRGPEQPGAVPPCPGGEAFAVAPQRHAGLQEGGGDRRRRVSR